MRLPNLKTITNNDDDDIILDKKGKTTKEKKKKRMLHGVSREYLGLLVIFFFYLSCFVVFLNKNNENIFCEVVLKNYFQKCFKKPIFCKERGCSFFCFCLKKIV